MPTKTTAEGRDYDVDGKRLTWHPLDDNDEPGNLPDVTLPLRIKFGVILDVAAAEGRNGIDNSAIATILAALIPGQMTTVREMDTNDVQAMFVTWQAEYSHLTGASLGESSSSSA